MKSLIVFSSSHGTTEKAARLLSNLVSGDVDLLDLKKSSHPDLKWYDAVIIGGSIHVGSVHRNLKRFIERNLSVLVTKNIGLFICCMQEGQTAKAQFEHAFPKELRNISLANGLFGGEFIFSKMNFIERQMVKKISGIKEDLSKIDVNAIGEFADSFNNKTSSKRPVID